MSHNWIEFTEPASVGHEELYVSLNPEGRLLLARKTCEALGDPRQVVMLFDPGSDSIGVRPAPPRAVNAFRIQPAGRSGARLAFIARFIRKHDIRLDGTVRFPTAHIDNGDLVLDLHTRIPAPARRKRKKNN